MSYWANIFLALAAVAGLFGFGGFASATATIAQVICLIFLAVGLIVLLAHGLRQKPSRRQQTR